MSDTMRAATGCQVCGHKKADHRLSVWDPSWGEHHKWKNQNSAAPFLPMKAQNVDRETFLARIKLDQGQWQFERKYDGMRVLVQIQDGETQLWSRTGMSLNATFPELTQQHLYWNSDTLILDGEIETIPESLEHLQMRMGLTKPEDVMPMMQKYPVEIVFFDILWQGDADLTGEPLWYRRNILENEAGNSDGRILSKKISFQDLEHVFEWGWEGCVAKNLQSKYHAGKRRADWKKFKYSKTADLVVIGTKDGKGQKEGRIGSFVVGYWDQALGRFIDCGHVGAGLVTEERLLLEDIVEKDPYGKVVIEVEFMGAVKTGKMREPRILRIRFDKDPKECDGNEFMA